jgi:hypothetical protein
MFLASLTALAAALPIVAPAPSYNVWLFSVAASEWSLAIGIVALFGIGGAAFFGRGKIKAATILTGAAALLIALYPLASAFSAARENAVSLSPRRYVGGFLKQTQRAEKKTFDFAAVGGRRCGSMFMRRLTVFGRTARALSSFTAARGTRASAAIFPVGIRCLPKTATRFSI